MSTKANNFRIEEVITQGAKEYKTFEDVMSYTKDISHLFQLDFQVFLIVELTAMYIVIFFRSSSLLWSHH